METKQQVYDWLDAQHIAYEAVEHPAMFTIDEMDALGLAHKEDIVKNLFLRDARGRRHFLVVVPKDKKADLRALRAQLGSTALSFASEERLMRFLHLTKGSVTPLGVLNDGQCAVEVFFDRALVGRERIGVHPNDNTATVFLPFDSLFQIIRRHGNPVGFVDL